MTNSKGTLRVKVVTGDLTALQGVSTTADHPSSDSDFWCQPRIDTKTGPRPRRRRRRAVENDDFARFCGRIIRRFARRVSDGDVEALADLDKLSKEVNDELHRAVAHLRSAEGGAYSWRDIGRVLGISRQAAQQRFPEAGGVRYPGGQPGFLR